MSSTYVVLALAGTAWQRHKRKKAAARRRGRKRAGSSVDSGTCLGMDIGGTLSKIVFFEPAGLGSTDELKEDPLATFINSSETYGSTGVKASDLTFEAAVLGGKLHFILFQTHAMEGAVAMVKAAGLDKHINSLFATGGGAYKYAELCKTELGISLQKRDELQCLVAGVIFCLRHVQHEAYALLPSDPMNLSPSVPYVRQPRRVVLNDKPTLLVNIGSGVSILLVNRDGSFHRVSGTSLGGGTYWGLMKLMTGVGTFKDALNLSDSGDAAAVDLLVGDIYGGDYAEIGLPAQLVASRFGKVPTLAGQKPRENDVAASLLRMLTENIAQLAFLNAKLHGATRVFFAGSFLRHNVNSMRWLSFAIRYWSAGSMEALFFKHEGFFGALGAFCL